MSKKSYENPRPEPLCTSENLQGGLDRIGSGAAHRAAMRLWLISALLFTTGVSAAGEDRFYLGAIAGVATLSADAGAQAVPPGLNLSSYAPRNGGALDALAGVYLGNYFSLQADYIWNRNGLRLNSASSASGAFYEQDRSSSQRAGIFDVLVYFRRRTSRIRPYLATGIGVVHLSSTEKRLILSRGAPIVPPSRFSSTEPILRTHVGVDLRIARRLDFRYCFSETLGTNDISRQLSPPGSHKLMNFQNLFGFIVRP
jgi:Outer membrane protein beta-barrel domain